MDKGKIAEGFISLVMEREQAATVVGDLLEAGASRSIGWFWSNVFRTCTASVWRDAKSDPGFVLSRAVLGVLVNASGCAAVSLAMAVLKRVVISGFSIHETYSWGFAEEVIIVSAGAFRAGGWIVRFSLGKEVAVCVAMVFLAPIIFSGVAMLLWGFLTLIQSPIAAPPFTLIWWNNGWMLFSFVPCLLGAALARRRRHNAGAI